MLVTKVMILVVCKTSVTAEPCCRIVIAVRGLAISVLIQNEILS